MPNTYGNEKICDYPCDINDYLYFNGSCLSDCSLPFTLRLENSRQFCDFDCNSTAYLYWDSSCVDECPSPLIAVTSPTRRCHHPCPNYSWYYNTKTGACTQSCSSPSIEGIAINGFLKTCEDGVTEAEKS